MKTFATKDRDQQMIGVRSGSSDNTLQNKPEQHTDPTIT
jgi:hypothetical protein